MIRKFIITFLAATNFYYLARAQGEMLNDSATKLVSPLRSLGKYEVVPNQMAANAWYKPLGSSINGHISDSFVDVSLWPRLASRLRSNHGLLGIYAAEIGYLTSSQLAKLRADGIGTTVEMPAWTQCQAGEELAGAELYGKPVEGRNVFQTIFHIDDPARSAPFGHGWLTSKDGMLYAPEEIVLDERTLNLPAYDLTILAHGSADWLERLRQATRDDCPNQVGTNREANYFKDYLYYFNTLKHRYAKPPRFSFQWNVNVHWEWRNPAWLTEVHNLHPEETGFRNAYTSIENPSYVGSAVLNELLAYLCKNNACPRVVYMDVDTIYNGDYALESLRRNKAITSKYGVGFGIDLDDETEAKGTFIKRIAPNQLAIDTVSSRSLVDENKLTQDSILTKLQFFMDQQIIDEHTHVRIQSWISRPYERGKEISENVPGSFAATANRVFDEHFQPLKWVH